MNANQAARQRRHGTAQLTSRSVAVMLTALLISVGSSGVRGSVPIRESKPAKPCSLSHYGDFAFWVGSWDVFDVEEGKQVARAEIDSMLNNCLVSEDYQGMEGGRGISLSSWNARRHMWTQHWVSDKGATASIEGNLNGDTMVLIGTYDTPAGHYLLKGIWRPEGRSVRETAWRSQDGGHVWKQWFDLRFIPQSSAHSK
jgi:hypothetical protein